MREIEFRGKQRDNGEWVYGSIISKYDADACGYCNFYIIETPDFSRDVDNNKTLYDVVNYGDYYEVKEETIGQYTGLKDKNGTKIFEGDIVIAHYFFENYDPVTLGAFEDEDEITGKIVCDLDGLRVVDRKDEYRQLPLSMIQEPTEELEVIGNIYDNPELIKGDEN